MNPVTGPFLETFKAGYGRGSRYWSRQIYRQQRPYDLPLPYSRTDRGIGTAYGWGSGDYSSTEQASSYGTRSPKRYEDLSSWFITAVENKARERLIEKLGPEQLLAATLAEARGTIGMMDTRLRQAGRIVSTMLPPVSRAIHHASLINDLGKVGLKGVGKGLADGVLEVFFGIAPIMSDVQSAAEVLSKDFLPHTVEASAKLRDSSLNYSKALNNWWRKEEEWWLRSRVGCEGRISNPNLYLAQKLGLINPFATAWELFPWSFVVDYFVNVNSFVGSLTDTYGCTLSKPYTRNHMWSFSTYESRNYNTVTGVMLGDYITGIWCRETRARTSLPAVRLGVRPLSLGKDLSRLVTSSALLLQRLTRWL